MNLETANVKFYLDVSFLAVFFISVCHLKK